MPAAWDDTDNAPTRMDHLDAVDSSSLPRCLVLCLFDGSARSLVFFLSSTVLSATVLSASLILASLLSASVLSSSVLSSSVLSSSVLSSSVLSSSVLSSSVLLALLLLGLRPADVAFSVVVVGLLAFSRCDLSPSARVRGVWPRP
jgi:hypothetical protein